MKVALECSAVVAAKTMGASVRWQLLPAPFFFPYQAFARIWITKDWECWHTSTGFTSSTSKDLFSMIAGMETSSKTLITWHLQKKTKMPSILGGRCGAMRYCKCRIHSPGPKVKTWQPQVSHSFSLLPNTRVLRDTFTHFYGCAEECCGDSGLFRWSGSRRVVSSQHDYGAVMSGSGSEGIATSVGANRAVTKGLAESIGKVVNCSAFPNGQFPCNRWIG